MKRVKIGVIGTGGIFCNAHLPSYPNVNEAKLSCLCDISADVLKNSYMSTKKVYDKCSKEAEDKRNLDLAERLREDAEEIKTYCNVRDMFAKEELDLVDICTPTKFHSIMSLKALNQRINVMVEKPMARTYLECLDVIEAIESSGKLYQYNENWLYMPLWYNAKKLVESGVIGEIQLIFIATAHGGPEWASWFWNPDVAGGGSLLDNGVHAITTAWFLSGFEKKPEIVKSVEPFGISRRMKTRILKGRFRSFEVEDDAHILIRFEDSKGSWSTAHIEGSWSHRDSMETAIIGSSGSMRPIQKEEQMYIEIADASGRRKEFKAGPTGFPLGFDGEIRNMCNCILDQTNPLCDERIGAETIAIVQSAYLSQIRGKRPVRLSEFKKYALELREKEGKKASEIMLKELMRGIQV